MTNLLIIDDSIEIVLGVELAPACDATAHAQNFRKQS